MKMSELPSSVHVATSDRWDILTRALEIVIGVIPREDAIFTHYDIVEDGPRTGRVFFEKNPPPGTVKIPEFSRRSMGSITQEILLITGQSRYDPPENPNGIRGWEVRRAELNGSHIAIVWTTWIPR